MIDPKRLRDPELYKLLTGELYDAVMRNFEKERAGTGGAPWQALAKSTIRDRSRKGYWPGKILQRRGGGGGLLASITGKYNSTMAEVGTNRVYAAIHQFGGTITQGARSELFTRNRYKRDTKSGKQKGQFKRGTKPGRGFTISERTIRIPARPFLILGKDDYKTIEDVIFDFLTR